MAGAGDIGAGIGGAVGGIAVLAGAGGKGGDKYYKKAVEVLERLQDPEFDWSEITAPELKVFAQYFPETYSAVVPDQVKTVVESPELRLSELRSLKKYEQMADEGLPLEERLAGQEAGRRISAEAGRAQEGAIQDVAARGRLGTSDELGARLTADQSMMELERGLGADLAQQGIGARRAGLEGAAGMAGQIRGEDFRAESENANIMNRLAEFISNQKTEENMRNAQTRQAAAWENADQSQRIGEANELARYNAGTENLDRKNQLKSALADYRFRKAGALSGAYTNRGLQKDQDKAAREQSIMNIGQGAGRAAGGIFGGGAIF